MTWDGVPLKVTEVMVQQLSLKTFPTITFVFVLVYSNVLKNVLTLKYAAVTQNVLLIQYAQVLKNAHS
jgi:hypothetical protein